MKQAILIAALFLAPFIYSQNAPIDFESGGNGASWTWTVFENVANLPLEIVANPDPTGANTSATVAKFTALQAGQPYAGCESLHGADIGTFSIDATNSIVKIMVWKTETSDVGIKFSKADGWSMGEIKMPNTVTNAWEEITFNFSAQVESGYDQIVIFPDFQARAQDNIIYFDNITFSAPTAPTEPTVAAPTPTQDPADVISIYSGTYTDIAGTDFNPGWGQTTIVSFVEIVGNETMKYETFNYQGIQLAANQELSEMEFMHLDIWTPDATVVKTTPISATTGEFLLELTPLNQGVWNSYDIPVGDFAGVSMADIHQLKFDGQAGVNPSNLFIDNIYFYKVPTTATEPTVAAPTPTQDPVDVISMFSDAYTDISVDTWLTPWSDATLEDVMIDGNPTKKYSNMNFIGIETVGPNLIDASTMTYFHMDVWTPDANDFKIKLVDFGADAAFGGGDDSEHELVFTAPVTGSWISYDIPIADFTGLLNTDHIAQLIMVKAPLGTIFVDNVFYYKDPFVLPEPTVAAPTPTQDPGNVISMFSDVYTDVPVDTWLTSWSDATLEDVMIDGNPTKKYTEVNVIGIETTGANLIDASNMTSIHIDFWTPDANDFKIKLVDFGADAAFGGGDDSEHELVFTAPATETWVSYNIPLVLFTNLLSREHLAQLIFSKAPMGTLYIDNVYYYNPTLGTAEFDMLEMNVFPNPTTNLWNFTSNHSIENILVYDVVGKTVIFVSPNANEVSINASSINEGIYFAKIKTTSGITEIKLIKK